MSRKGKQWREIDLGAAIDTETIEAAETTEAAESALGAETVGGGAQACSRQLALVPLSLQDPHPVEPSFDRSRSRDRRAWDDPNSAVVRPTALSLVAATEPANSFISSAWSRDGCAQGTLFITAEVYVCLQPPQTCRQQQLYARFMGLSRMSKLH